MGFFDDVPGGLERPGRGGQWDLPSAEFPRVAVADALILARTGEVAVAVTAILAFRAGFEFWVRAQFRHSGPALADETDDQSLHVGVQFADGRKVANIARVPEAAESVPAGVDPAPARFRRRAAPSWSQLLGVAAVTGGAGDVRLRVGGLRDRRDSR